MGTSKSDKLLTQESYVFDAIADVLGEERETVATWLKEAQGER